MEGRASDRDRKPSEGNHSQGMRYLRSSALILAIFAFLRSASISPPLNNFQFAANVFAALHAMTELDRAWRVCLTIKGDLHPHGHTSSSCSQPRKCSEIYRTPDTRRQSPVLPQSSFPRLCKCSALPRQ